MVEKLGTTGSDIENALRAVDEFFATFNARDREAYAATLNYPHVRIHDGNVIVWRTPEEFLSTSESNLSALVTAGWHHSEYEIKDVIHSSNYQVHVALQFTRHGVRGNIMGPFQRIYVVTCKDGHWGIQARLGFSPQASAR